MCVHIFLHICICTYMDIWTRAQSWSWRCWSGSYWCWYICTHIHMCIYMYTCIYVYIYICICIYTWTHEQWWAWRCWWGSYWCWPKNSTHTLFGKQFAPRPFMRMGVFRYVTWNTNSIFQMNIHLVDWNLPQILWNFIHVFFGNYLLWHLSP